MKAQLFKVWDRLRSSFWFLPALMVLAASALALGCVTLEEEAMQWLGDVGWLFSGGAEGASAVLSTIASSMITIAGVVFSVTLVALALTSQQFGPRLLRNFTRDTVTHTVMGTFVATFVYCLLVLRSVRHGDDGGFVPHLSVSVGVLLAVASVGVLIYFIHHICILIQADEIVSRVGHEFIRHVDRLYPECEPAPGGTKSGNAIRLLTKHESSACGIDAIEDGYLQAVDLEALLKLAVKEKLIIRVEREPGAYVTAGHNLATVSPGAAVSEAVRARVRDAFAQGVSRAGGQDIGYAINQLVEIAVRALSPSLNDPFTAIRCVDRLGSGLGRLINRPMPESCRYDGSDELRLVVPVATFASLAEEAFSQIRPYVGASPTVSMRLLDVIAILAESASRGEDRAVLGRQAEMIARSARSTIRDSHDVLGIENRLRRIRVWLARPGSKHAD